MTTRAQWKGTDACVDLYCDACGYHSHVDAEFLYFFECRCGALFMLGDRVPLIRMTDAEVAVVRATSSIVKEQRDSEEDGEEPEDDR